MSRIPVKGTIKLFFVVFLLYFLGQKGFLSIESTLKAFQDLEHMLPGYSLLALVAIVSVLRWELLLKAQSVHVSTSKLIQLGFIGNFFNIALPGAVSGDFVKAVYVGKNAPGQRASALSSILFDRVSGLSALILVSFCAFLLSLTTFVEKNSLMSLSYFISFLGLIIVLFYGYLFFIHDDPFLKFLKHLETKIHWIGSLKRTYEGILNYQHHRMTVILALGISFFIHCAVVLAFIQFSYALGEELHPVGIFVVAPMGLLLTAIPLTPGGIGTGHAAFLALFKLIGSSRGADIFTLYLAFQFLSAFVGRIIYLQFKSSPSMT